MLISVRTSYVLLLPPSSLHFLDIIRNIPAWDSSSPVGSCSPCIFAPGVVRVCTLQKDLACGKAGSRAFCSWRQKLNERELERNPRKCFNGLSARLNLISSVICSFQNGGCNTWREGGCEWFAKTRSAAPFIMAMAGLRDQTCRWQDRQLECSLRWYQRACRRRCGQVLLPGA